MEQTLVQHVSVPIITEIKLQLLGLLKKKKHLSIGPPQEKVVIWLIKAFVNLILKTHQWKKIEKK